MMKTTTLRLARFRLKSSGLVVHVFDNGKDLSATLRADLAQALETHSDMTGYAFTFWNWEGNGCTVLNSGSDSWAAAKNLVSERFAQL